MHSVIIPHAVKVQVQNQSSGVEEVILHRFNKITCQISKEQQQKPSAVNHLKHLWKRNSSLVTAAAESLRFKFNLNYMSLPGPCAVLSLPDHCAHHVAITRKSLHYDYALKVHDWITLYWISIIKHISFCGNQWKRTKVGGQINNLHKKAPLNSSLLWFVITVIWQESCTDLVASYLPDTSEEMM